jgi:CheY-like chemotaxis protein
MISPVTVRLWATKGLLPSLTTPGGHRRYRTEDVDAFIAQRRRISRSSPLALSRMLIIDDDPQYARYLRTAFSTHAPAISIDVAADGFTAGIKCEALRPDAITLDLHMPDMNGFEVCEMIRSQFGRDKPRIIALTGFPSEQNRRRILAAGANACLAKTAPIEELMRELGVAIDADR